MTELRFVPHRWTPTDKPHQKYEVCEVCNAKRGPSTEYDGCEPAMKKDRFDRASNANAGGNLT